MKITTDKIAGFADMTDAEKVAALLDYEVEDTPKQETDEVAHLKKLLNDATGEASKFKKALRERETEAETKAREQAEQAEAMKARLAEFERRESVAKHLASFMEVGYGKELAQTSAEAIADGNFGVVFDNLATFIAAKTDAIKADVLKTTPVPKQAGTGTSTITKEQFDAMGLTERMKLYTENRELYDTLSK